MKHNWIFEIWKPIWNLFQNLSDFILLFTSSMTFSSNIRKLKTCNFFTRKDYSIIKLRYSVIHTIIHNEPWKQDFQVIIFRSFCHLFQQSAQVTSHSNTQYSYDIPQTEQIHLLKLSWCSPPIISHRVYHYSN